jgi:ppGpp synthetase/RelA/SpoT-type nucleotidyltranferase
MNEASFKEKWESELPVYKAWGEYVVSTITQVLERKGKNLSEFLKIPPKSRLKDTNSLIDKAFHRKKTYAAPYSEIEDKVGIRFVVLLVEDIKEICEIIEESEQKWSFDPCKHFDKERQENPLLFTYQSVHYVLRPKENIEWDGVVIPPTTPCEVQVRTLLQHAHAELTHDAIYKSKKAIQPVVHRTVAKSMALIETTDGFFSDVTQLLNHGPLEEHNVIRRLDGLYESFTGLSPHTTKSSITIWDEFEDLIDTHLVDNVQEVIKKNNYLARVIKEKYSDNTFYQQSTILFVYWMLKKAKRRLLSNWPLSGAILEPLANDLGVSTEV